MKNALGLTDRKNTGVTGHEKTKNALGVPGFPYQLSPMKSKIMLPIPPVNFTERAPSLKKIFNAKTKIYIKPDEYFTTEFREIFQKTKLR